MTTAVPPRQAADPVRAREALRTALASWQRGDKAGSLRTSSPAVHVTDQDWARGQQLVKYQILPGEEKLDVDLSVKVELSLKDVKTGRTTRKTVVYRVGTDPELFVARTDHEN
jgi:hypothetical protein